MKKRTPNETLRLQSALRYLRQAEAELEAAGENLVAMRVSALARGLE
jgi:hypothetical protein